jgi:hypothetical protein
VFEMTGLTSRTSATNLYRCGLVGAIILTLLWSCSDGEPTASVNQGAEKKLRLIIKWPGDDPASKQDLELRDKIEQLLVEKKVGKIVRSGTGMGWMDIVLEVKDKDRARTEIEGIVKSIAPDANFAIQAEK